MRKKLSQDLFEAKSITKGSYALSFDTAIDQVKHFFPDKDLNLGLLDPSKFLLDIIRQESNISRKDLITKGDQRGYATMEEDKGG